MVQPSQQHVAPCVKGAEWVLGTRGLGLMAAFLVGIPIEVTKEVGVVPRCRRAAIGTPFYSPHIPTGRDAVGVLYPLLMRG